ncbi:MAG: porin, partial [Mesorhizobium sp.]
MNIKSLLLGSAAALIAVSGARAADAVVVAEPEPAEYVKICDVYGAGYFYIPGTETCLRIGGYVRYDISAGDVGSFDGARSTDVLNGKDQGTWHKNARFALKTWTGQETELGTLKTYTQTKFNFGNSAYYAGEDGNQAHNKGVTMDFAWIQLGGLRVGLDDSAFDSFIGYAGNVLNDTIVPYGDFSTNLIQYNFDAGNGFSAVISLEEGSVDVNNVFYVGTIDSYVPHVVGGVKYTQGWGAIAGVVAYDTDKNSLDFASGRDFYKQWGGHWAWWAGGTYKFNPKTSFNLQVSGDQDKNYGVAANVAYDVVPGLTVTAEVDYDHYGHFN